MGLAILATSGETQKALGDALCTHLLGSLLSPSPRCYAVCRTGTSRAGRGLFRVCWAAAQRDASQPQRRSPGEPAAAGVKWLTKTPSQHGPGVIKPR